MMNKIRLTMIVAVLSLCGTGLLPSNLKAATLYPANVFLAAGSSGQFNATGVAALSAAYNGNTPCTGGSTSQHWTSSSTLNSTGMQVHDPRSALLTDEVGTVWIGWDANFIAAMDYDMNGGTEPSNGGTICAGVSLDSTLGTRLFFAYGQFILNSPAATPDGAKIPNIPAGSPLPTEVVYYFNTLTGVSPDHAGVHPTMNVGPTDILEDDTKFATIRAMDSPAGSQTTRDSYPALGYGGATCGTVGSKILSSVTSAYFQVADFVLNTGDTDCFTGAPPRPYTRVTIGQDPVLVLANVSNTAAGHLGDPAFWGANPQINRQVLANVFSGLNEEVGSVTNITSSAPLHVFNREPLSGTYNTFDFNVTCSDERYPQGYIGGAYNCQETGVNPASCPSPGVNCGNPFIFTDSSNAYTRQRVIGTGQMDTEVIAVTDGIGYSFWGFGNFNGDSYSTIRYLPVDGIDPLYATPSGATGNPGGVGFLPQCPTYPCPTIPFTNVINGSYPIWTVFRWLVDPAMYGAEYNNVYAYLEDSADVDINDFYPVHSVSGAYQQKVFRSHYTQLVETNGTAQYGSNGVVSTAFNAAVGGSEPELGGDMGGQVFTVDSEVNYVNDAIGHGTCTWITITNSSCEQLNFKQ